MRDFLRSYLSHLLPLRSLLYSLAFVLYLYWAQPILLGRMVIAKTYEQADWPLGIGILCLQAFDMVGYLFKWPVLRERVIRWPEDNLWRQGIYYLALLVRLPVSIMVMLAGLLALGINLSKVTGFSAFFAFVICSLLFVKEACVLAFFFDDFKPGPAIDLENPRVQLREFEGEILLIVFAMVSFSLTWDFMLLITPPVEPGGKVAGALGAILIFLFLYPASRLAFVAEESLTRQSRANQIISTILFLSTMAICVFNVPGIR